MRNHYDGTGKCYAEEGLFRKMSDFRKVIYRKAFFFFLNLCSQPCGCRQLQAPPSVTESCRFFKEATRNAELDRGGALCGSERHTPDQELIHPSGLINFIFSPNPRSLPAYTMAAAIVSAFFEYDEVVSKVRKLFFQKVLRGFVEVHGVRQ